MQTLNNNTIFITGGAGFIGATLAKQYIDNNKIIVYDNFDRDNLSTTDLMNHPNITIIEGDIMDVKKLTKAANGSNIIIHAAAIAGIDNTVKSPVNTMTVNMIGTYNALQAALSTKETLNRFLDFSTSEIFGSQAYLADESCSAVTGAVGEARWTYAVSKLAGEHLTYSYYREFNLPTVTIRPFNIYGPGQVGEGAISVMIRRALNNQDLYIFGEGNQIRAWCFIDDMINALGKVLINNKAIGESLNIGNARAVTTIYGLAEAICRVLGSQSKIVFKPALSADIELRIPSVEKAKKLINFEATIDLDEGLIRTAEWITKHEKMLPELPDVFTQ